MFEFLFNYSRAVFDQGEFIFASAWPVWALIISFIAVALVIAGLLVRQHNKVSWPRLAGIGVLLYVRAKGSHIWLFGLGVFAVLLADILTKFRILPTPARVPLLYGVGGGLILAFFLAILWFWAKRRATLEGPVKTAADLQLTGYVFLVIAMWYLCGDLSRPYQKALEDLPLASPVSTIVYLVLGWLFLLLSQLKSAQVTRELNTQNGS